MDSEALGCISSRLRRTVNMITSRAALMRKESSLVKTIAMMTSAIKKRGEWDESKTKRRREGSIKEECEEEGNVSTHRASDRDATTGSRQWQRQTRARQQPTAATRVAGTHGKSAWHSCTQSGATLASGCARRGRCRASLQERPTRAARKRMEL